MVRIRTALPADLDAIREIYNYYIRTSTATFLEADCTPEEMTEKYESQLRDYPFLAAEEETGEIAGFAYASRFRMPSAYRLAETTIYLSPHRVNRGIGLELYSRLIRETRRKQPELTGLVACITLENQASIRFHEKQGFLAAGVLRKAGFKFGRFCDVGFWHYLYAD